jgi:hypothetical protein
MSTLADEIVFRNELLGLTHPAVHLIHTTGVELLQISGPPHALRAFANRLLDQVEALEYDQSAKLALHVDTFPPRGCGAVPRLPGLGGR